MRCGSPGRTRRLSPQMVIVAVMVSCTSVVACTSTHSSDDTRPGEGGAPGTSAPSATITVAPRATTTTTSSTSTSTSTSTTVSPGGTSAADEARLLQCVRQRPLRDRVAMLVWPAVKDTNWAAAVATVRDQRVGGVLLMQVSPGAAPSLASLIAQLDAVSAHGVLIAADEEGGDVQRLRAVHPLASQHDMSQRSVAEVAALLAEHAPIVAANGVDVVLGPVVDVRPDTGPDALGDERLFVGSAETVAAWAQVYVDAWQTAGLTPVLKHFPGHGSASGDSHDGRAVTPALSSLLVRDLVPYTQLANSGAAVMIGHLDVPGLTDGVPASLSPAAVSLLRDDLGWGDALVLSDSLGMGAIGVSLPEAAVASVAAGVDVVVFTSSGLTGEVIDSLVAAVQSGRLSEARVDEAAARVARTLEAHGTPCA